MDAIAPEFEKFAARHQTYLADSMRDLDELIDTLRDARDKLAAAASDGSSGTTDVKKKTLTPLSVQVKSRTSGLTEATKEISLALAKCGKAIDKKFGSADLEWNPRAFDGRQSTLHQLIAEHFVREGKFDLALAFQKEAGLASLKACDSQFQEMHHIVEDLRKHNLSTAIEWAEKNRFELNRIDSTLEFSLHKAAFLQILRRAPPNARVGEHPAIHDAISYARHHLGQFPDQIEDIQRLMGLILFLGKAHAQPPTWKALESHFAHDFCTLLGQSPDPPLFTAVTAGTSALPVIMKMATIMKEKKNEWTSVNELPVEIPLLSQHRFHSIFACPVSREQGSDANPPMMLPCGHTICNESLKRLSKNPGARFKCPYCPCDTTAAQALQVHL